MALSIDEEYGVGKASSSTIWIKNKILFLYSQVETTPKLPKFYTDIDQVDIRLSILIFLYLFVFFLLFLELTHKWGENLN